MQIDRGQEGLSKLLETLASLEHERWSHWQRYMHNKCAPQEDGSLVIPAELARRWERLMATPYRELSEQEKESDREQVRRYIPVIVEVLGDQGDSTQTP
jgi:hypothetical protein